MPDRRGKPLRAGDKVIYAGAIGFWFGTMKYDEGERKKYHIYTEDKKPVWEDYNIVGYRPETVLRYFEKVPDLIINMSAWAHDIEHHGLDMPDPI